MRLRARVASRILAATVAGATLALPAVVAAPAAQAAVTRPGKPVIGDASSGSAGGNVTATARWSAPRSTGGPSIRGYVVRFTRYNSKHVAVAGGVAEVPAAERSHVFTLDKGIYRFDVLALNAKGASDWSAMSGFVTAR